jgi:hypothetical protein
MPVGQDYFVRQFLGSDYAPVYYPGVPQLGQAQAVSVSTGEEAQVDLVMRQVKTVEISGRVIGPDGTPATDASINLEETQAEDYGSEHYTSTDAKGNFSLKGVPPGSYVLFAAYQRVQDDKPYRAQQIPPTQKKMALSRSRMLKRVATRFRSGDLRRAGIPNRCGLVRMTYSRLECKWKKGLQVGLSRSSLVQELPCWKVPSQQMTSRQSGLAFTSLSIRRILTTKRVLLP